MSKQFSLTWEMCLIVLKLSATKSFFFLFISFPLTSSVVFLLNSSPPPPPPQTEHQGRQGYSSSCASSLHKIQFYNRVEAGNCHWLPRRKQHVFRAVEWHWTNYVVTKAILLTYYLLLLQLSPCWVCLSSPTLILEDDLRFVVSFIRHWGEFRLS